MKKLFAALMFASLLMPFAGVRADVPVLQVHPLQYQDIITTTSAKRGYIDVSNPSDTTINLVANVQGFRQTGTAGQLQFFDDPKISDGIKVDLTSFELGPREAIRVAFNVDPTKLPQGGVYAAIFFRTVPPEQSANSSYVAESANIGTLLLLQNGGPGVHLGQITKLGVPFWQFGRGLTGSTTYRNINRSNDAVGFDPALSARVLPWGQAAKLTTGLVLPASERQFDLTRTGSYFGLLPVTVSDTESGGHATAWVFAVTGWYQPLAILLLIVLVLMYVKRRNLRAYLGRTRQSLLVRIPHYQRPAARPTHIESPPDSEIIDDTRTEITPLEPAVIDAPDAEPVPQPESEIQPEPELTLDNPIPPAAEPQPQVTPVPELLSQPDPKPKTKPKAKPKKRTPKPKT